MGIIRIKKGLNLPITGEPAQEISEKPVSKVAVVGSDYVGMKPTMLVEEGDSVKLGQVLFTDKKCPSIKFTSPGSGKVIEINRGERRVLQSVVIKLDGDEEITLASYKQNELLEIGEEKVKENLIESGLWTSIRCRPFSKLADPKSKPNSIFVNGMETNPLAPDMSKVLAGKEESLYNGLKVLSNLTDGKVFFIKSPDLKISPDTFSKLVVEEFTGPHPAGLSGTHIHFLDPVSSGKKVWYLNLQETIAIGDLFTTGKINVERIISLAGSETKNPRLIKTRLGASIDEIVQDELAGSENRVISGSVFSGSTATGKMAYLGRYHQQIVVLKESKERGFLGWMAPGFQKYSVKKTFLSAFIPGKRYPFTTQQNGGVRAIVPVESYERVMPMDILPTFLLRSLAVDDIEEAEKLGCLELDEEDLGLCTFVCPSKINHGENLRRNLTIIEKEG